MEANFQTSFIPKKPVVQEKRVKAPAVGFTTVISFFIFFACIMVVGGLFLYKKNLESNIVAKNETLELARGRFEKDKLSILETLDRRLQASTIILSKHIAVTPIFQDLQGITLKNIQYTDFTYEINSENTKEIIVRMKGKSIGYRPIAIQSDLYAQNKHFIDPVFSNLVLDDFGNVVFDLEFKVDPTFVDYRQMLMTKIEQTNSSASLEEMLLNNDNEVLPVEDSMVVEEAPLEVNLPEE